MAQYIEYLKSVKVSNQDEIEARNVHAVALFNTCEELRKQIAAYEAEIKQEDAEIAMFNADSTLIDEMIAKFQ